MPKVSPLQSSFLGGEISPFCFGRVDSERYKISLAESFNAIPLLQGGWLRRPGTRYVCEAKYRDKKAIVQRFEFSITQAYMIEFGEGYIRFMRNNGQIVEGTIGISGATQANPCVIQTSVPHGYSTGQEVFLRDVGGMSQLNGRNFFIVVIDSTHFSLKNRNGSALSSTGYSAYTSGGTVQRVYEISSPYSEAEVEQLTFVQSADVLYILHNNHRPAKLIRSGHTAWTLQPIQFIDGPYLPIDTSGTTLTPSDATSPVVGIHSSADLFAPTDIDRHIRVQIGTTWHWMKITTYVGPRDVICQRFDVAGIGTAALTKWRLGAWSDTTGYPAVAAFHEGRLVYGGSRGTPQRFDMSVSDDYDRFSPTDEFLSAEALAANPSTVTDAMAVSRELNSDDVNYIFWMSSEERALLVGTAAAEWAIRPSVLSEPISPNNINAKQVSNYGSARIQPVIAGKSSMFVQASTRTVREMTYDYRLDGYNSPDRTVLADHISGPLGFKELIRQKEKPSLVWGVRNDGALSGMTYEREDDALIVAWHRHALGGYSDAAQSDAQVMWGSDLPSVDGKRNEVWFIVKRWINGEERRTIEYLTKIFEHEDDVRDAFHVDCGITYDNPLSIIEVSSANPAVVTVNNHGFNNGDVLYLSGIKGMVELNGKSVKVANKTTHTFHIVAMNGVPINSSAFHNYVSGGFARKFITTITGLWHLEGESVDFWADGALQPRKTVTNGAVVLQNPATTVHIGFPYKSRGKQLRLDAGSADGTAIGKTRRIHRVGFLLHRTLGLKIGVDDYEDLQTMNFRTNTDPDGRGVSLYTGIKSETLEADYNYENQICWEFDRPTPGMILAVGPQLLTEDRG